MELYKVSPFSGSIRWLSQHLYFCLTYLHLLCVKLDRFYRLLVFEMCFRNISVFVCSRETILGIVPAWLRIFRNKSVVANYTILGQTFIYFVVCFYGWLNMYYLVSKLSGSIFVF